MYNKITDIENKELMHIEIITIHNKLQTVQTQYNLIG